VPAIMELNWKKPFWKVLAGLMAIYANPVL
jgi:hypothetical protein